MDYVFFGFSSLCLCFCVLLLFGLSDRTERAPRLWQLLVSVIAGFVYYYLQITVFRDRLIFYYLFNSLPQILLIMLLALVLLRKKSRRA